MAFDQNISTPKMNISTEFQDWARSLDSFVPDSDGVIAVKAIAFGIVTVVALVGNSLVVAAILQSKKMRTVTNYLIMNVAIVDILYVLVTMPVFYMNIFSYYWSSESLFFKFCCKAINFSQYMLQAASVLTLAAIAADRYFAIMMPLKRILTKNAFLWLLGLVWFASASVAAPILYAYKVVKYDNYTTCAEDWAPAFDPNTSSKLYTIVLFIVAYCVPFLAMTIVYSIISKKLWTRKAIGEGQLNLSGKKILESRKKVVKMLVTVVIVFIICWLPIQIISLWGYFTDILIFPQWLVFMCMFVMRAHPALNPCIYAIFSENFREEFKMAIRCFCCRRKSFGRTLSKNTMNTVRLASRYEKRNGESLLKGYRRKHTNNDNSDEQDIELTAKESVI